jgi:hypothetical protein
MFAVIVYTLLAIAGLGISLFKLEDNGWRPVWTERDSYPITSWFFGALIACLMYWWMIASIGWVFGAILMVTFGVISLLELLWSALTRDGRTRLTVPKLALSTTVTTVIVVALWVAVL